MNLSELSYRADAKNTLYTHYTLLTPFDNIINYRFAVEAFKCQHDHFAVCPVAQAYIKDNLLLGTGTGQFEDDCAHYILPWEEGFNRGFILSFAS